MLRNRNTGFAVVAAVAALGIGWLVFDHQAAVEAAGVQAPRFEVDPLWPKPLPNHWIMGNVIGVTVDAQDHLFNWQFHLRVFI